MKTAKRQLYIPLFGGSTERPDSVINRSLFLSLRIRQQALKWNNS
nr:MAG TPA: hypothetical protein [Bacteriophage sp.]